MSAPGSVSITVAARLAQAVRAFVIGSQPRLARGARALGRGSLRAGRSVAGGAWHHRAALAQVGLRAFWWAALAIVLVAARDLVAFDQPLDLEGLSRSFAVGLGACAVVLVASAARHLRFAAWALGTVHGAGFMLCQALLG